MDSFEQIVRLVLEQQGYWVRTSYKVKLTKEDKVEIELPSCPRWELDVVAFRPGDDEIQVIECKSYLDSLGVKFRGFDAEQERHARRYKLFTRPKVREVVFKRLADQLCKEKLCASTPKIRLGLAAGRVATPNDRDQIRKHFDEQGWVLYDDLKIQESLSKLATVGYENDPVIVATKILLKAKPMNEDAECAEGD